MTSQLLPLLSQLSIRTEDQQLVPLTPNWAQAELVAEVERARDDERPARIIVLKARRLGISTLSEALLYLWALTPNTNCCVVAHDREASEYLFGMAKLYQDTFLDGQAKLTYPTKYASKRNMYWDGHGSTFSVMTAENVDAARSRTLHALHCSEVGFWSDPTATMLSLMQTIKSVPGTLIILESTANGVGNWFEETWTEAQMGKNDYVPMFFPWHRHPSFIPCQGYSCTTGTCDTCLSRTVGVRPIDDTERDLMKLGVDIPHLTWRRWCLSNKCFNDTDLFSQEYPSTPEEAFILSGVMAFPESQLKDIFVPKRPVIGRLVKGSDIGQVRFVPDARGPLRIYKMPDDKGWGRYFIGGDPAMGSVSGDYAAAQVINRRSKEQVAVFQGRINPIAFADELAMLGTFYNMATIAPEVEGGGIGTIARLVDIYPNLWHHHIPDRQADRQMTQQLGWSSSWKRKQWLVAKLAETIERGGLTIHDQATYKELRTYSYYGTKGYGEQFGPADAKLHDDLVMSLGIAIVCEATEPALEPYDEHEGRLHLGPEGVVYATGDDPLDLEAWG